MYLDCILYLFSSDHEQQSLTAVVGLFSLNIQRRHIEFSSKHDRKNTPTLGVVEEKRGLLTSGRIGGHIDDIIEFDT